MSQVAPAALSNPLTDQSGVKLRAEAEDWGALEPRQPVSWREATKKWREYVDDRRDFETVFINEDGDTVSSDQIHRFAPEYADKQYAKLKDLERGLAREYGKRLHTAMLTFTASSTDESGDPLPPVDHLIELDRSWNAVTTALDRSLENRRYERLAILEPHKSGYFHIHMAVFVDGKITEEDLAPVIESHVSNCPLAEWEAHDVTDESTISVRHAGADRDLEDHEQLDELAIYLAEYLGTYGDDPLEQPDYVQAANAVLWVTGKQRWRPSNGAQSFMATERSENESDWKIHGVRYGDEFQEVDPAAGGVDWFKTDSIRDKIGPPGGGVKT